VSNCFSILIRSLLFSIPILFFNLKSDLEPCSGGHDLNIVELKDKLEAIQLRLANIEEIALEKELLHQHVSRLVQKQEKSSDKGKTPALSLARQLNAAQSQLKARTRTTMARVAELSIVKVILKYILIFLTAFLNSKFKTELVYRFQIEQK
jgi:hypothetical protein